jgi:hypothetical protein
MTATIFKFPYDASRRVYSRRPRVSKNGTPEERATLREMVAGEVDVEMGPKIVGGIDYLLDNRPPARSSSTTGENGRLRIGRREVWRMAEAATRYWRVRLDFDDAVSRVQRNGMLEGSLHPDVNPDDRWPLLDRWRAAFVRQLLTPAPGAASVK